VKACKTGRVTVVWECSKQTKAKWWIWNLRGTSFRVWRVGPITVWLDDK
jgi:hypothetical protein